MFDGPRSGVQLSYQITQGAFYTQATTATHLWGKMAENSWKLVFDDTYLQNLLLYTQIYYMVQQVVFNYQWVSPKVVTTLMTLRVTLLATLATHLCAKMVEKHVSDNSYPHNL
jgi:hypothetical protein